MSLFTVEERERVRDRVLLPPEVLATFEGALPPLLEPAELFGALAAAVDGLVRETGELGTALEPQLRSISQAR